MDSTAGEIRACSACGTKNRVPVSADGHPRCASCKADLPWVVDGTGLDFDEVVLGSSTPVLVDVWAEWCGPCRMVAPVVEQLATEYAGRLKVVKIDADADQQTTRRLGVQGIPALFFAKRGRVVDHAVGAMPHAALDEHVRRLLAA